VLITKPGAPPAPVISGGSAISRVLLGIIVAGGDSLRRGNPG
jgi:hypothetical protein